MGRHARQLVLAVALLSATACVQSSVSSPTPTPAPLTGIWMGALPLQGQTALMTWTLTQTNASVTGPVLITLPNGIVLANGVLTGSFANPTLTFSIAIGPNAIPSQPTCTGQLTGTAVASFAAATTLTGSLALTSSSCTIAFSSSPFALVNQ